MSGSGLVIEHLSAADQVSLTEVSGATPVDSHYDAYRQSRITAKPVYSVDPEVS